MMWSHVSASDSAVCFPQKKFPQHSFDEPLSLQLSPLDLQGLRDGAIGEIKNRFSVLTAFSCRCICDEGAKGKGRDRN